MFSVCCIFIPYCIALSYIGVLSSLSFVFLNLHRLISRFVSVSIVRVMLLLIAVIAKFIWCIPVCFYCSIYSIWFILCYIPSFGIWSNDVVVVMLPFYSSCFCYYCCSFCVCMHGSLDCSCASSYVFSVLFSVWYSFCRSWMSFYSWFFIFCKYWLLSS